MVDVPSSTGERSSWRAVGRQELPPDCLSAIVSGKLLGQRALVSQRGSTARTALCADRSLLSPGSWLRFFFPPFLMFFFLVQALWNMQNPLNRAAINRRWNIVETDYVRSGDSRRRSFHSAMFSSPRQTPVVAAAPIWVNVMQLRCVRTCASLRRFFLRAEDRGGVIQRRYSVALLLLPDIRWCVCRDKHVASGIRFAFAS